MSSPVATTVGNVVVVTHVHPVPQGGGYQPSVGIQKFIRGRPMALGTVQIMIGLIVLLFGIVMATQANTLGVFSGIFVWGALIYITAGSLTVAAGKVLNRCLVNGALSLSVVAAVVSCTATILCSLDAGGILYYCYDYSHDCYMFWTQTQGFSGVLAVFHLLELVVSVTTSGFACNATCNCTREPSVVVVNGGASATMHAPPNTQAPSVSAAQLPSQVSSQMVSYAKNPQEQAGPPDYQALGC